MLPIDLGNFEITGNVRDYILGGDALFTVLQDAINGKKAVQMKYRVKMPKKMLANYSLYYLSAEPSDGDITKDGKNLVYQGYIYNNKGTYEFRVGDKGVKNYNTYAINGLLWILNHADNLPSAVHVFHHGRCSVCGKRLQDAESLKTGVGPICRKRIADWGIDRLCSM